MSLAVHVRIPPPLGQVPPLMDPLLVYVQGCLAKTMEIYGKCDEIHLMMMMEFLEK